MLVTKLKNLAVAGAMVGSAILASNAMAADDVKTFTVDATVSNSCGVSASSNRTITGYLDFGTNAVDGETEESSSTSALHILCNSGTVPSALSVVSANVNAGQKRARIGATAHYINYSLSTASSGGTEWTGTTGAPTLTAAAVAGVEESWDIPIYILVPAGQPSATGSYTDTVTFTVSF
jgi:spore coat protein U-like protein